MLRLFLFLFVFKPMQLFYIFYIFYNYVVLQSIKNNLLTEEQEQ